MNIIFTTFTYGLAIPLVFPLAFVCLLSLFVAERIQVAKYYKKPPHYDIRLNQQVLEILQYAPLPMMFFGYWFLGNR
jgi:hypothetical protein